MNSLQIKEVDNEVLNDADGYLREHKILELFEVSVPPLHLSVIVTKLDDHVVTFWP